PPCRPPGEAPPVPPGAGIPAGRRNPDASGRRPRRRGDPPGARPPALGRAVPGRPLLPAQRLSDPRAAPAGASRGDRAAAEALRRPLLPQGRETVRGDRPPVDPPVRGVSVARERPGAGEPRGALRDPLPGAGLLPESVRPGRGGRA